MSSARNLYLYIFDTQYSSTDQQERGALTYYRRDVSSVEQRWQSPHSYFALAMVAAQRIRIGTSNRVRCNNNLHKRGVSCTSTHDAHLKCMEQIPCRCGGLGKSQLNRRKVPSKQKESAIQTKGISGFCAHCAASRFPFVMTLGIDLRNKHGFNRQCDCILQRSKWPQS